MRTITLSDPKCASLRAYGSLNPHPERVSDALFQAYHFFDPRDVVQVKYEMLRRVRVTGQPVGRTASAFGYSRVRLAQLRKRFAEAGMVGLLPQGKGPRRAHKLTDEVLGFVLETLKAEPEMRTTELPRRVAGQFGISVHRRSIERALARRRKKGGTRHNHRLQPGVRPSAPGNTKSCAAWPWRPERMPPAMRRWRWPISKVVGWLPGWRIYPPVWSGGICQPLKPRFRTAI
jgi:transposase